MRIWLINVGEEIPTDVGTPRLLRTGILAEQLSKRGHEVIWWNSSVNHQRKQQRTECSQILETGSGYRIVLLYGRLYRHNISIGRILSQFENAREFQRIASEFPTPDAILCGYPTIELAEAAVRYAVLKKIPIATDFRDMWPDIIEHQARGAIRLVAFPLLAKWRRSLKFIVKNTTAVTGITDSFVDWALAKSNRNRSPLDRAFHLAINPVFPDTEQLHLAEAYWDKMGISAQDGAVVGCFAGTLSSRLDIGTIVEGALKLKKASQVPLKLVICGDGPQREVLQKLKGDSSDIILAGWRTAAEIHALLRRSDFGILPYPSLPDFVRSYPNKVGEYLSAGLPIMTGLQGEVRKLLSTRNIGFFYQEASPQSAEECFNRIVSDLSVVKAMRPLALATYQASFDGSKIYPAFCDYLEHLADVDNEVG